MDDVFTSERGAGPASGADGLRTPTGDVLREAAAVVERLGVPIDLAQLAAWSRTVAEHGAGRGDQRYRGHATPLQAAEVDTLPAPGSPAGRELEALALAAVREGQVAIVILAGGMATRMGGGVKALVEAVPGSSFLDLRLAEQARWRAQGADVPLWLMTSDAVDPAIREALADRLDDRSVATFRQNASLRLTPSGELFRDGDGALELYATGHGDLPDALARSGLLERFVEAGGRWLMVANIDNVGASLDPRVLGSHIAQSRPLTLEVVENEGSDAGGGPVRLEDGRLVALESFRLPAGIAAEGMPFFSTNTFWLTAEALLNLDHAWTYASVTKQVDGRPAVQFERILNELTLALPSRFLLVPRHGAGSRFLPVKDWDELERRRPEILAAIAAATRSGSPGSDGPDG